MDQAASPESISAKLSVVAFNILARNVGVGAPPRYIHTEYDIVFPNLKSPRWRNMCMVRVASGVYSIRHAAKASTLKQAYRTCAPPVTSSIELEKMQSFRKNMERPTEVQ